VEEPQYPPGRKNLACGIGTSFRRSFFDPVRGQFRRTDRGCLLSGPEIDQLSDIFGWNAFSTSRLLAAFFDSGEERLVAVDRFRVVKRSECFCCECGEVFVGKIVRMIHRGRLPSFCVRIKPRGSSVRSDFDADAPLWRLLRPHV